jgi:8-oxo-dGTP diphosphatase
VSPQTSVTPVVLGFVRAGDRLLLLRAGPGKDRFRGLWNGIGGHVRAGEDIRAAARREIREEAGLEVEGLELRAVIHETGLLGRAHLLFVFFASVAEALAREAPPSAEGGASRGERPADGEGELAWFPLQALPHELVPDLHVLLPRVLAEDRVLFGVQEFDGTDRPVRLHLA